MVDSLILKFDKLEEMTFFLLMLESGGSVVKADINRQFKERFGREFVNKDDETFEGLIKKGLIRVITGGDCTELVEFDYEREEIYLLLCEIIAEATTNWFYSDAIIMFFKRSESIGGLISNSEAGFLEFLEFVTPNQWTQNGPLPGFDIPARYVYKKIAAQSPTLFSLGGQCENHAINKLIMALISQMPIKNAFLNIFDVPVYSNSPLALLKQITAYTASVCVMIDHAVFPALKHALLPGIPDPAYFTGFESAEFTKLFKLLYMSME